MTDRTTHQHLQFEYPDQAGYPDGVGTLTEDQVTIIDQLLEPDQRVDMDITVVNEEKEQVYTAIVGDTALGAVTYNRMADRIVLLAAAVYPEFRRQGVASEMIRQVLDDVREQGKRVTNLCPIVRTFIDRHPQYEDLIDPNNPGILTKRGGSARR
ncbi:GNAT family N-acetyltransferase [Planctomonas sp. JC2975]|uniref:GNAT family N-acetyltransferase n=1 Tax=Planctomonas sp. JC2975 TaxID=2729626 RepID=UPI001475AE69|nr:GNAT family N-acetyltransferase [Planctomonas sp. JC2975]NNC11617.1 GNAT family N-acetyltransferase [Planctomonas sp. JC2975]